MIVYVFSFSENMQAHSVCFCKCLSVSFEHVFTVKSLHVQPHKELIGFSLVSCLTEISWSKLKSVFFTLIKKSL